MGELCRTREARQPRGHLGPQPVPRDPLRQRHVHLRILLEDLEVPQGIEYSDDNLIQYLYENMNQTIRYYSIYRL